MTDNTVERRNKFPNPRFSMSGTRPVWQSDQAQHITYNGDDQLAVVRPNANDPARIVMWPIKLEPGQKYHFQCIVWHHTPCKGVVLYAGTEDKPWDSKIFDDGVKDMRNAVLMSADFAMPEDKPILCVGFYQTETGDAGSSDVHYWNPLLELSSTYDAAVNAGGRYPVYFDYGTLPE